MISSIRLRNFKNFADETLLLGPFTVIVGANASGKSNILDAFRLLHGIGRGYSLADTISSRFGSDDRMVWEPIRGAATEIIRYRERESTLSLSTQLPDRKNAEYSISICRDERGPGGFRIRSECLNVGADTVYSTPPPASDPVRERDDRANPFVSMAKTGAQEEYGLSVALRPDQPALSQLQDIERVARIHKELTRQVVREMEEWRFLDPKPDSMRRPCLSEETKLGDSGENLPAALRSICNDRQRRRALLEWICQLTPMEVAGFEFPQHPITGLVQFSMRESNGREISAYSASDGTLRFLALLAALLEERPARLIFVENLGHGIHPSRLHLLVDLIERQTIDGAIQVVATTHSPELLSVVSDDTFRNTSLVCRTEDTNDAIIRPVARLRGAERLRSAQGLGRLLAGGWMETALAFTECEHPANPAHPSFPRVTERAEIS